MKEILEFKETLIQNVSDYCEKKQVKLLTPIFEIKENSDCIFFIQSEKGYFIEVISNKDVTKIRGQLDVNNYMINENRNVTDRSLVSGIVLILIGYFEEQYQKLEIDSYWNCMTGDVQNRKIK